METDFPYEIILYLYHIPSVPNIVNFRKSVTFYVEFEDFLCGIQGLFMWNSGTFYVEFVDFLHEIR